MSETGAFRVRQTGIDGLKAVRNAGIKGLTIDEGMVRYEVSEGRALQDARSSGTGGKPD